MLCAKRVVGNEPFALLLADDLLTHKGNGITLDLIRGFEKTGKIQLNKKFRHIYITILIILFKFILY